jgi:hypothetical protein
MLGTAPASDADSQYTVSGSGMATVVAPLLCNQRRGGGRQGAGEALAFVNNEASARLLEVLGFESASCQEDLSCASIVLARLICSIVTGLRFYLRNR